MKNIITITITVILVAFGLTGCAGTDNTPVSEFVVCQPETIQDRGNIHASFVDIPMNRINARQKNAMCWGLQTHPSTGELRIYGPETDTVEVRWVNGAIVGDPVTVECIGRICKLQVVGPDDIPVVRTF
jgi:hypothetical protein